jgi:alpha-galactosidase
MNMNTSVTSMFSMILLAAAASLHAAQTVSLGELDLNQMEQDYGRARVNRSVDNQPISIGGKSFEAGVGTHAFSRIVIDLHGDGELFSAMAGVDDGAGRGAGRVVFRVLGDGRALWQSQTMHGGDAAVPVKVSLKGVKQLSLLAEPGADGNEKAYADWAEATITMRAGAPVAVTPPQEPAVILTPKPSAKPRINSARVLGVRPGAPVLFTIAATGDRPMTFAAQGLPDGLQLDPQSGRITGVLSEKGEHLVTLRATNARGTAEQKFRIVCGPKIGLTPAMGWNSWNCFGASVTAANVKAAADAMVKSGLINHGWTYINVDDYWEVKPAATNDPTLQGPRRDERGRIIPNPRFPDMKALADYIHERGLKAGLYSSPGPLTCGQCIGSYQHEFDDAASYAEWGFDYLKYDWCTYTRVVTNETRANYTLPTLKAPYQLMRTALDSVHRDILFSFCQYGMGKVWEWGAEVGGNSWRTTGDIRDAWGSMAGIGFRQAGLESYAGPGHFNDPDMLVVGLVDVGRGRNLHPTHLSPNEQYTHISLWCLLDAPLLIGCDMTRLDDFTLNLLENDEVLEVNQDPLGRQAARVAQNGMLEVWAKDMEDGSKAVGLFNRGQTEARVTAKWSDLRLSGKQTVRDLWRQKNLGTFKDQFEAKVPRHGVVLVRMWPAQK